MSRQKRRRFTPEQKAAILREHLVDRVPVSDLCERHGVGVPMFYRWQKQMFDSLPGLFQSDPGEKTEKRIEAENRQLKERLAAKDAVIAEIMGDLIEAEKKDWGPLVNIWVAPSVRDAIVAFVLHYAGLTGLAMVWLLKRIGIGRDRFCDWRGRVGQGNRHNAPIPREHWLEAWEQQAIVRYFHEHPEEGYRRLTWMMVDEDVVAASPSSVYRVLKKEGLLDRRWAEPSKKGTGFEQPAKPHEHWHSDISYLNIGGTTYFFLGLIDGASRYLVHWEIRTAMTTDDVQIVIQRAREKFPEARPRIISDNGSQYLAREFKEFIRTGSMTHVKTSPYYPQSNGKIERFHGSLKRECIRTKTPVSLDDARAVVGRYVEHYNDHRLHSAIGYLAPRDKLHGRDEAIWAQRKGKLREARLRRQAKAGYETETPFLIEGGQYATV